jgi:hypothetical protein
MPTAGLFIHLKADAITGLADGDPVASWTDSSGNSRHATQSTAGSKPIYKTNILNGKPVVRFDGADDFLNLVDLSALTEGEIFIVVKINNDPPTNEFKAGLWYIGSEPNGSVLYPSTDSIIYDSFGTTVRKAVGNPTPSLTSFRIYSVYSAPNDWQSFLDGFSLFSTSTSTVGFNSAPTLGKSRNPTQAIERFLDGDVAEVIFYNHKLSTSVRSDVQGYLNAKYFV